MSRKERDRLVVMAQVKHRKLSLGQASGVLGLSYRQTRRVWRHYRQCGDAGLVRGLRGRPSSRRKAPQLRARILKRYRDEYGDFGPTWRRSTWGGKMDWQSITRRCGDGLWPKEFGKHGGGASGIDSGGSARRAWVRWCNWMDRTTIGLRAAGQKPC
jgi:hypothetical protein